ncbi:MAG: SpoIIE family protein phosphatase [Bacteroidales bacterium]|nr:SpoIIE family protein phosphatase [Bacteroidales bacterium]
MKYRSVQLGVVAISIASISILLLTMFFFYRVQQRENENISHITNEQRNTMVDNIMELKIEQEQTPVFDNSAWDELQDAMAQKDMEWIDVNIGYMSVHYHAASVALFDTDNKLFYDNIPPGNEGVDYYSELRLPAMFRDRYKNIFYAVKNDKLFAYYIYKIVSADDILTRQEQETGYIMLIKEYTDSLVTEFSRSLGSVKMHIALNRNTLDQAELDNQGNYFYHFPLNNQYGNPVAYLYFTASNEVEGIFMRLLKLMLAIFGLVLLMLLSLILYTQLKIVRPLHKIADVFYTEDVGKISGLMKDKSEFGVLSNNIDNFFKQKYMAEQMHKEMVERNKKLTDQNDTIERLEYQVAAHEGTIETLNRHIADTNRDKELKEAQLSINEQMLDEQMQNIYTLNEKIDNLNVSIKMYEKQLVDINEVVSDNQNYAVRLRNVMQIMVTPTKHVLREFFVYEKPKDRIGGDFPFALKVENWVIVGVGDCNMQGISGAMLSAIDIYLLNEVIRLKRLSELRPDRILNDLNNKIQSTMGEVLETDIMRDGLHISLFMYDTESLRGYYAGSKRTMVMLRRGEVSELFGDNLSVGKVHGDKSFNCVAVQLEPEDLIYMYSDGCTEVEGGPYCKKLLAINFKKEIAHRQSMPLSDQKNSFREFYENWIGDLVQSDDITLMGFRV